jgi:hypothetical protein
LTFAGGCNGDNDEGVIQSLDRVSLISISRQFVSSLQRLRPIDTGCVATFDSGGKLPKIHLVLSVPFVDEGRVGLQNRYVVAW